MGSSALNENEIFQILKIIPNEKFLGVFGCDELANITQQGCLIVNTDPSYMSGTHWISIIIKPKCVNYYDPLSLNFWSSDPNISNFLIKLKRDLYINSVPVQTLSSPYCGHHCVTFCYIMMMKNISFRQFLNFFSPLKIEKREHLSLELFKNIRQKARQKCK